MKQFPIHQLLRLFAAMTLMLFAGCSAQEMHLIRAQPNLQEALRNAQLGNTVKAKEWTDRAITADSHDASLYVANSNDFLSIAAVYLAVGDDPTLITYMQQGAREFPNNETILAILSQAQGRIGDTAGMKATATSLATLIEKKLTTPGTRPNAELINTLAQAYWDAGDTAKGALNFQRSITTYRTDPSAYNDLAYAYAVADSKPNLPQAVTLAEQAITLAQKQEETDQTDLAICGYEDTLGWVLYRQGDYRNALYHLTTAISGDPRQPEIHYHLAMTYLALGQTDSANSELIHALRLNKTYADAQKAYEKLNPGKLASAVTAS